MSEKPANSTETPSAGNKSVDFVDKIAETIGKITSTIRGKISSVFGGLGNLLKKGFNKLFGEPEKEKDTSDEKPDEDENPKDKVENKPESSNNEISEKLNEAFKLKIASLTNSLHQLKEAKEVTDEQSKEIRKSLEEAQENMDRENPDMEEVAKKLDSTTNQLFNLIKSEKLNIKQDELTEEQKQIIKEPLEALGENSSPENIKKTITTIIKKAAKENIETLAIPALGTGTDKASPQESAKAIKEGIMDAIDDLVKIKEITLVLNDEETMKTFEKEFKLGKKKPADEESKSKPEKGKEKNEPKSKKKTTKVSGTKPNSEVQEAA